MAQDVSDANFEKEVLNSSTPVLVDFWAEWCGPCKMLTPTIDQLAKDMEGKVKVVKINIDENPDSPTKYGVRSIPTLILFKGGKQIDTKIGSMPLGSMKTWIESNI